MTYNEQYITSYFKAKGLTDAGVAGIIGNVAHESGANPNNLRNDKNAEWGMTDEQYTAVVNSGAEKLQQRKGAYGIAQWLGGRKEALQNFADARGVGVDNLEMQCDFMWQELQDPYRSSCLQTLQTTDNPETASRSFQKWFEGCDQGTSSRISNSKNAFTEIQSKAYFQTSMDIPDLSAMSQPTANISIPDISQGVSIANNGKIFDSNYYAQNNQDVVAAIGSDSGTLLNHYNTIGESEGRMANAIDTIPDSVNVVKRMGEDCLLNGDADYEIQGGNILSVEANEGTPEFFLNGESLGVNSSKVQNQLVSNGLFNQATTQNIDALIAANTMPEQTMQQDQLGQITQPTLQDLFAMMNNQQTVLS